MIITCSGGAGHFHQEEVLAKENNHIDVVHLPIMQYLIRYEEIDTSKRTIAAIHPNPIKSV
ncbi:hypothetical protein [Bacillus sp. EB106-08-02-XG196]|uniref:hypothetical protein n=1 Tax=Bacillus sp. EB106-08-02-XG196 TaxID=2737049 RepID=UPI001C4EC4A4|nr:hypothetical protein [Bacillus sp. EB106-08-02-XG196]